MKILMLMGGGDVGGAKTHIMSLALNLSENNSFKLVSFRNGEFPNEAKEKGIDVEIISTNNLFKAKKELKNLIKNFKPDVIHGHGTRANLMTALVRKKSKIPTISTVHSDYKLDYLGNRLKQSTFGLVNAVSLRKIDYQITVADKMQQLIIKRGYDPNNIFKIYNGIDFSEPKTYVNREEYFQNLGIKVNENDVILGIAARLTEVKDIPTLLKAFEIVCKSEKNVKLMIAGDGEDRQSLEKMAKDLKIEENVYFLGWISDVKLFFSAIDINLLTSISETFPYSILEGILENCATICSDVGGMNKIIDTGINGYIFEPKDYLTLSNQILSLVNDDVKRKDFTVKIFEKASENFSLERTCKDQMDIYRRCIKKYEITKNTRNKITICGAYGKGNAGDDAILQAIVSEMRQINEDIPICVMSRTPIETKQDYLTDSVFTFDVLSFAKSFKKSELYINGGGSLIQDVTSSRSLYFYLFTLWIAKKLGAKVMMYGCGIGPVNGAYNRKIATKIINKSVDTITLRDEISAIELEKMGVNKPKIVMSADPTMNIEPNASELVIKAMNEAKIPENRKYLGIGVRKWKNIDKVIDEIAKTIEYASEKYDFVPVFLPIEYPSDIEMAKLISQKLNCEFYTIENRQTTETTIGLFAKMDLVLGIRLHSLIFSAGNGVPVIGMSYDIKVDGFLKYINSKACVNLDEVKSDILCEMIDLAVTNDYKKQVLELSKELKTKEYQNIIEAKKMLGEN